MVLSTTFSLVDFNDLFVIAIGLSAAYMLIKTEQRNSAEEVIKVGRFYTILNKITDSISKWTLNSNSKILNEVSKAQQIVDYYDKDESLDKGTWVPLKNLLEKHVRSIEDRMDKVKKWNGESLYRWGRANYFHVLTFDCFCFGIIMLIIGAFEHSRDLDPTILLHWLLYAMLLLSIFCIVYEPINIDTKPPIVKWFCPGVVSHFLILLVALIAGSLADNTPWPSLDVNTLALIAAAASFGGFLVYFGVIIIIAGIMVSIATFFWTLSVRISSIRSINRDISFIKELTQFTKEYKEGSMDAKLDDLIFTNETTDSPNYQQNSQTK